MSKYLYQEFFRVTGSIKDTFIITAYTDMGEQDKRIHRGFLESHGLDVGSSFMGKVDDLGELVLETIQLLRSYS